MSTKRITVRVNETEYQELTRRAKAANTSMSRFLVDSALRAAPRNDRQLSDLMGRLCALEVCMQRAADYPTLVQEICSWKQVTADDGGVRMAVMKVITRNAPNSPYTEKYHDDDALRSVIGYGNCPEKAALIGGWAVDPANAAWEMALLSRLYRKDSGIRLRHWTVDFLDSDIRCLEQRMGCDRVTAVWRLACELTAYYACRYHVFFAVHTDKPLPHIHAVMNVVSYVDGSKYSGSKAEYYDYERYARQVARRYGFFLHAQTDHSEDKFLHSSR